MSHSRLGNALLACLVVSATVVQGPQGRAEVPEPTVDLRLIAQPVSHGPRDDLSLTLRIHNGGTETLEGFQLNIGVSPRIQTRSGLHDSFVATPGVAASSFSVNFTRSVSPSASTIVPIDEPLSTLDLEDTDDGGVYPLTVTLYDATFIQELDTLTTPLVFYPAKLETSLKLVLVLPINDVAARGPDGVFAPDIEGRFPLEEALGEDGWITGLLDALEGRVGTDLHLGIAPTPRLIEEVADMADGFRRREDDAVDRVVPADPPAQAAADALQRLTKLFDSEGAEGLLVPYSFVDLPVVTRALGPLVMQDQILVGEEVLTEVLGEVFSSGALFAPAGRLDAPTLDQLPFAGGADVTFFVEESLEPPIDPAAGGCPEELLSFTCPIVVATSHGPTHGYVSDRGLQERFAALNQPGDNRLDLQRFFAETAMIREELPGVEDRVVEATVPSLWHPAPRVWELLFRGLAGAEWLRTKTPTDGMRGGPEAAPRIVVDTADPVQNQPDDSYFDVVIGAADLVEQYESLDPPPSLPERLRRDILVSHSRTWWGELGPTSGERFATDAQAEAEAEMDKITLGGADEITLTSRRGEIQFGVFNDTGYPVRLLIRLDSIELEVDPPVVKRIFDQPVEQVTFQATAKSSGAFPMEIEVQTPDGSTIAVKQITVRSTRFNQIALGITIGALAFLILFYAIRGVRRRGLQRDRTTS